MEELSLVFQEGFMDENEYHSRKEQIYEKFSTKPKVNIIEEIPNQNIRESFRDNSEPPYKGIDVPNWADVKSVSKDFSKQKIEMTVKIFYFCLSILFYFIFNHLFLIFNFFRLN